MADSKQSSLTNGRRHLTNSVDAYVSNWSSFKIVLAKNAANFNENFVPKLDINTKNVTLNWICQFLLGWRHWEPTKVIIGGSVENDFILTRLRENIKLIFKRLSRNGSYLKVGPRSLEQLTSRKIAFKAFGGNPAGV